jgi:hypothetical protein
VQDCNLGLVCVCDEFLLGGGLYILHTYKAVVSMYCGNYVVDDDFMVGSQLWVRLNFVEEEEGLFYFSRLSTNYGGSDLVAVYLVRSDSSRRL